MKPHLTIALCVFALGFGASATAAQATAATATAPEKPFMIGVLPFADRSGSGVQDLPITVAREIAAQLGLTPGLEAHVIELKDVNPNDMDGPRAVAIGRKQNVDAVLAGSLVRASSKQSDTNLGHLALRRFGGGANIATINATVALEGVLYDVTTGRALDTVRASKDVSQRKIGGDVSTNIGDFSTGRNSFKSSPIGQAVQAALENLAVSISADEPKMSHACIAPPGAFGSKEKTEASIEGTIYYLPDGAQKLPSFSGMTSQGSIYTSKWDVPPRDFQEGFPGVTDRFEWFAIDYNGPFYVSKPGKYAFHVSSDDGSILYFDAKPVVTDDGVHGVVDQKGSVDFSQGMHRIRLSYFQGPRTSVALQVWVTPPGGTEKLLDMSEFNKEIADSRSRLGVTENSNEIDVKFGAELLFDTGKYDLKPSAEPSLEQLANLVKGYPGFPVMIEGHTDNVGSAGPNQTLSENRAKAVKDWLMTKGGVSEACITIHGFGETKPVATNDTAEGRQKNRRVEVHLMKPVDLEAHSGS
jgi:outer membrane protein OmpA-like peptidoglycan-associated protein